MDNVAINSVGEGEDVVFLHGFGADRLTWLATTPSLSKYRVHTVDLPGHGKSSREVGDGSLQELADSLFLALAQRIDGPFHIVGHSLGGGLATIMANQAPDLVSSMFLIAPAGFGGSVDTTFLGDLTEVHGTSAMQALLSRLVVNPNMISQQTADYGLAMLNAEGTRDALRSIANDLGYNPALGQLPPNVPTFCVWGAQDRINTIDERRLALFDEHLLLPNAGHLPHIEAAGQVNSALQGFLSAQIS